MTERTHLGAHSQSVEGDTTPGGAGRGSPTAPWMSSSDQIAAKTLGQEPRMTSQLLPLLFRIHRSESAEDNIR